MFSKLLLTILIASNVISPVALQDGNVLGAKTQEAGDKVEISVPQKIVNKNLNVKISGKAGIAIDKKTGQVLYSKNIHTKYPIASITKLMTALVFLDLEDDLDKTTIIQINDAIKMGKSRVQVDESVKLKDLLYTSLISSDNTATMALVRSTGLTREEFVKEMNNKSIDFGLSKTFFTDPVGLDEGNISTAFEVNLILRNALKNEIIAKILPMENYSFTSASGTYHHIKTTNKLLNSYLNILGGKTGYTEEAGYCFTGLVKLKNNQEIITVVLGSEEPDGRFQDTKAITSWVENNYQW